MSRRRNKHHAFALVLVMILVVVAAILGFSYLAGSTVQMVSSDNLLWATRARYLGESGLDHAAWLLRTDPEAPPSYEGTWMGPFEIDGAGETYQFRFIRQDENLYAVSGRGSAGGISQTASMTLKLRSNYAALVAAANPQGIWRLGEPGGGMAFDSAYGNHGIYHSVSLGHTGPLAGTENTAASFNGTSSCVEILHSDRYLLDDGTILLWFKAVPVNVASLFSKDSDGRDTGGHLTINIGQAQVKVRLEGKMMDHYLSGPVISEGQWYFVAFTFGGAGMKLYLNGELVDTGGYSGGLGATSGGAGNYEPIAIGANTKDSGDLDIRPLIEFFDGYIDEVAILSQVLTAPQVQALYEARVAEASLTTWD